MAGKSYGFALGTIRARENNLLTCGDMTQLSELKSSDSFAAFLRDKGWGNNLTDKTAQDVLSSEKLAFWEYIESIVPDTDIFSPFIYENDFHNLKVIIKGLLRDEQNYERLFMYPVTVPTDTLNSAVTEKAFDRLPDAFSEAAQKAYNIFMTTSDAQLSDAVLDRACSEAQMKKSAQSGASVISDIIRTSVLYKNIKIALRGARANKNSSFYDLALSDGSALSSFTLKKAALNSVDSVLELMHSTPVFALPEAAEEFKRSPVKFEKFVDNYIMSVAKKSKYLSLGPEPVIGYYFARITELKNAGIILSGILCSASPEQIMERLRDLYE